MQENHRRMVLVLILAFILAGVQLSACGQSQETTAIEDKPAQVEHLEGTDPTRVTLTEEAAKRLDIQTAPIRDTEVNGMHRKVIPYAAILYDTEGGTWTYTSPEPLTFVRHPIKVDYIEGDDAVLSDDLPDGTKVVTVGSAELYGSESEFEEE